jgi:hypothetical protein
MIYGNIKHVKYTLVNYKKSAKGGSLALLLGPWAGQLAVTRVCVCDGQIISHSQVNFVEFCNIRSDSGPGGGGRGRLIGKYILVMGGKAEGHIKIIFIRNQLGDQTPESVGAGGWWCPVVGLGAKHIFYGWEFRHFPRQLFYNRLQCQWLQG